MARALAIWLTRPEFVGWFNHSYYYWVQVRGLLESGQLPYTDLPLLFYLYAGFAWLLQLTGMELQAAIINTSRFWMSLVPALIALPAYLMISRINHNRPLHIRQWLLVGLAAFLPLSFAHMPELLQKNTLGLLLLSAMMVAIHAWLNDRSRRQLTMVLLLFVLISLTHLGTLAVAVLLFLSLLLAFLLNRTGTRQILMIVLLVAALLLTGLLSVYMLDGDAFGRILRYTHSSAANSLVGQLLQAGPVDQKLMLAAGIVFPLAVLLFLLHNYQKCRPELAPGDRLFWLCNVFLLYLLVFPGFDLDVVPRLILFMPLPLLVVIAYHLQYRPRKRQNNVILGVATLGIAALLLGEVMNLVLLYPDKTAMRAELADVKARYQLSAEDFVLTQYGVNPACNWFLGTRAGLITAFNKGQWKSYRRLFVLNPAESIQTSVGHSGQTLALKEPERYAVMRRNIVLPPDLEPRIKYQYFQFIELQEIPENWLFDAQGNWTGWRHYEREAN